MQDRLLVVHQRVVKVKPVHVYVLEGELTVCEDSLSVDNMISQFLCIVCVCVCVCNVLYCTGMQIDRVVAVCACTTV